MLSGFKALISAAFVSSLLAGSALILDIEDFSFLFGDIYKVSEYQNQIQKLKLIREELEKIDSEVVKKINGKSKTIQALKNNEINYLEAAAVFKYLNLNTCNSGLENTIPKDFFNNNQACLNLIQWLENSNGENLNSYREFYEMVQVHLKGNKSIPLPLPPAKLILDFEL